MSSYAQVAHSKHNIDVNNYCILLHWGKVTTVTTSKDWYKNKKYMKWYIIKCSISYKMPYKCNHLVDLA